MKWTNVTSVFALLIAATVSAAAQPFVIEPDEAQRPAIVVPFDPATQQGFDLKKILALKRYSRDDTRALQEAMNYLNEGIEKMTGTPVAMRNDTDLSKGIVVTTLAFAPADVRGDARVIEALARSDDRDLGANEAYYIRSEPQRLLLVANRLDGLLAAVAELLESVEYEVLGMGPNWIHVPDYRDKPLVFDLERSGRPSFYYRRQNPMGGNARTGVVTDKFTLNDPGDEPVMTSYDRWLVGARILGTSMPRFPGHAMQKFHPEALRHMRDTGDTRGFLGPAIVGPLAQRPPVEDVAERTIHVSTDNAGTDEPPQVSRRFRGKWQTMSPASIQPSIDVSLPYVRQIVLDRMRNDARAHFESGSDEQFIFGVDPEDGGGFLGLQEHMDDPQWYARYREDQGDPLGKPYLLHGKFGLDQPREIWDETLVANHVYALADWLLREFDKSDDPLLRDNAHRVRCSYYSYNFHDVPPTFNPNRRSRVMVAGYPKNRGRGRYRQLANSIDIANALSIMLPNEPLGDYLILSLAYLRDERLESLEPQWNINPDAIHELVSDRYQAGIRAITAEVDFNFGKYGVGYYLLSKMLWNADMSAADLDALRDRYLQRAFGSGWEPMKRYHQLFANMPVSAPNFWAQAIRLIDEADQLIDPQREQAAQRRLDDVKVYWLYFYLYDRGEATADSPRMREFMWKAQMSYQMAPFALALRIYDRERDLATIASEADMAGPAQYSSEQTQRWWSEILEHWQVTSVRQFRDGTLADGTPARSVDPDDLVQPAQMSGLASPPGQFLFNRAIKRPVMHMVAAKAGDPIGFHYSWGAQNKDEDDVRQFSCRAWYRQPESGQWTELDDEALRDVVPALVTDNWRGSPVFLVSIELKAPAAGLYRFEVGRGAGGGVLTGLNFDPLTGQATGPTPGATYSHLGHGLTQSPAYFYIPKGTPSLDLEVWGRGAQKQVVIFEGLDPGPSTPSREVDISKPGTHTIALDPKETGTFAEIRGNGFALPYFYSIPQLWAKSPSELLVPRAIAKADGLEIVAPLEAKP